MRDINEIRERRDIGMDARRFPSPVHPSSPAPGCRQFARRAGRAALRGLKRLGRELDGYASTTRLLRASDSWEAAVVARWQLSELNRLLAHAARRVPGYREKFAAVGFSPENQPLMCLDELRTLPFFTKAELRADANAFADQRAPAAARLSVTSGGTTGAPTPFFAARRTYKGVFDAWRHAMWARAGFRAGARCLDLTWAFEKSAPLCLHAGPRRLYLSINYLNTDAVEAWLSRVETFSPEYIIGFPSTAAAFAKLVAGRARFPHLRAVLAGSELLTVQQRATLDDIFGVRVFCWYGMAEMAGFASGCEKADTFHFWPQSGVLEIIGDDGLPVTQPGGAGEMVLTGFANRVTPFIRYRTGDRAILGEPCPECRRPHRVLAALEGRQRDFLLGRAGRVVPLSALNFHGDEFRRVFAHQFIQTEPGAVSLRVVPMPGFSEFDHAAITKLMQNKLGGDLILSLEAVLALERTARGKQPLIIQRCEEALQER